MLCETCQCEARRFGKDRHGNQRWQCQTCDKTWTDAPVRPLGEMRLPLDKAELCIRLLVEGNSVRSAARIAGVNRSTILDLLVLMGNRCETMLEGRVNCVEVTDVQCDEIWGYVGMKEYTRKKHYPDQAEVGHAYCFTAIERHSKLLLAWHLGTRCTEDCRIFIDKMAGATAGRFQVTTDGFPSYPQAMQELMPFADFAQLIKEYEGDAGAGKYSPGTMKCCRTKMRSGSPVKSRVCTSHVERHNLSIRMTNRRMTRLTNGFSKKWANHRAALALQFAHYNFCRIHGTLKMTPAMKAGLEDHPWTVRELIEKSTQS